MFEIAIDSTPADRALTERIRTRLQEAGHRVSGPADGADVLLLLPGAWSSDRRRSSQILLTPGLRHVVDVSFVGTPPRLLPGITATMGVESTSIRATLDEQAVLGLVGDDRIIRVPAAEWPVAVVAQSDVADAVAAVAADPERYAGRELLLTGPTAYGFADIADMLTAASGAWSAYYPQTPVEASASRRHAGMSAQRIAAELAVFDAVREGAMSHPTGDLAAVLGREPTDLWESLLESGIAPSRAVQAA